MSLRLPLFPLGTVLFPHLLLPLHVFEQRYRQLVRDLVPAEAVLDLSDKQRLLETGLFGLLPSLPGVELTRVPASPN